MKFLRIYCVLTVLSSLLALVACEKDMSIDQHLASARTHLASSEHEQALVELKRALRQDSQSGEARWLLGQAYLYSGDPTSAEKELKRSLALGWDPNDVIPLLTASLLSTAQYAQLLDLRDTGLAPSAKAELVAGKALAQKAAGDRYQAMALADKALDLAPESSAALLAKARILVGEGDFSAAQLLLEQVIGNEADNQAAWSLMGDVDVGLKQFEQALAAYDRAISLRQSDQDTRLKRALLHVQMGDFQKAQADAGPLLSTRPREPAPNYVQGLIHFQAGNYKKAITPLTISTLDFRQYSLGLFFLACAHIKTGHIDRATGLAAQYQELVPDSIRGRMLLGFIRLHEGRPDETLTLLDPILRADPIAADTLYLMANAMLRANQVDEGLALLARATAADPQFSPDMISLGPGRLLEGDSDEPAQYLETSLSLAPELQLTELSQVMRLVNSGDYAAAIESTRALEANSNNGHLRLNLLGRIQLLAGQQEKARDSFETIIRQDAHDPAANHNLAQLALARDDPTAAQQYYENILERDKKNLKALTQLALISGRARDSESMVWHLQRAIWAHDHAVEPRLLLGRHYLSQGEPRAVGGLFRHLEPVQQQSAQVLELVALAQLAAEEQEELRIAEQNRLAEEQRARSTPSVDLGSRGRRLIAGWVRKLAPRYGLDPRLVLAVIQAESNFNPGARSPANALGLMQLIPATAARFGVRNRADPVQNLRGGMAYLRWLLSFFEGELSLALAGYNAGEGAVLKHLGIPPYPETQAYVRKVLRIYGSRVHPPISPVVKPTSKMAAIRANQVGPSPT
jgi:putative PEP-CTERM system TPR-repeat lipoprotein